MTNATVDEQTNMINFFVPVDKPDIGALVLEINLVIELLTKLKNPNSQRKKRDTVGDILFSDYLFEVSFSSQFIAPV